MFVDFLLNMIEGVVKFLPRYEINNLLFYSHDKSIFLPFVLIYISQIKFIIDA